MHTLVVTFLLLTAPDAQAQASPFDWISGDDRAAKKNERDRCLTAAGAGIAGALVGAAALGAPAYIVGVLQNKGPDGELVGEPNFAFKRYFVPGFTLAGAFIGGALATVGTYYLVEPDEKPGVMR